MSTVPNNDAAMEKFQAELDAVDWDDLEDNFRGITMDSDQWEKYQAVAASLQSAQKEGIGIVKVSCLDAPNPADEFASAMIVLDKLAGFSGEAKAALVRAVSLCDRITVTTSGDKVRVSFAVDSIWKEWEGEG